MVSQRQILQLVDQIACRFNPERIILFGSYAYGTPTPDSDIDLLILMPCAHKTMEMEFEIRQAVRAPFAFDLLVRTPTEIAERIALNDCFITEILGKGKVLYEATNANGSTKRKRISTPFNESCGQEKPPISTARAFTPSSALKNISRRVFKRPESLFPKSTISHSCSTSSNP